MEFAPEGPMAVPLWINGHAYLTMGDSFFDVVNPGTGVALRRVPMGGGEEAAKAFESAQAAQSAWAAMGLPARQRCLEDLASALERYAGHFAKLLEQDLGWDAERSASEVAEAICQLRNTVVGETGLVALVVDSERPLAGLAAGAAPALLAGAAVIVKPSPKAPSAAYALCELTARAQWPDGVLNLLHGDAPAITGLCVAGVERLLFAGNAALGAQVASLAAQHGTSFVRVGD